MTQTIRIQTLTNGLTLIAESMDWLESAAFSLLIPAGCSLDPKRREGLSGFTCEMVQRGCGARDSRQFVEALDRLGTDRTASVSNAHTSFGAAMPAANLLDVLTIYADLVRRPHLPVQQIEEARQVCFQELRAVEDDLAQKVMHELRRRHYPDPWGRPSQGELEAIKKIALSDVERFFQAHYSPRGAILSVAGKIAWQPLVEHVATLLGDWKLAEEPSYRETPPQTDYVNLFHDSSQTHIGLAFHSVPYSHKDYYQARGAVGVLSDGMSSRLFTEVRERRGLCYTVYATCHSLRDRGSVICYAGTSTDRAQQTLDVLIAELTKLAEGIEQHELDRLKARVKSALIMQQESSPARSASMAGDWYFLGRVQTLEEIGKIVDGLTCDSINTYLAANPPRDFTIVTLGAEELEVPVEVS